MWKDPDWMPILYVIYILYLFNQGEVRKRSQKNLSDNSPNSAFIMTKIVNFTQHYRFTESTNTNNVHAESSQAQCSDPDRFKCLNKAG